MESETIQIQDELNQLKTLITAWVKELVKGLESDESNASPELEAANSNLTGEIFRLLHSKNIDTSELESAASRIPMFNLNSQAEVIQAIQLMNDEIKKIVANPEVRNWIAELRTYYQRILQSSNELCLLNGEIEQKLYSRHSGYMEMRSLLLRFWTLFLEAEETILSQPQLQPGENQPVGAEDLERDSDFETYDEAEPNQ